MVAEELNVLLASRSKALKEIVSVCLGEHGGVLELSLVRVDVVMVLDSLDNVALALDLQELLGHQHVGVVDFDEEATKVTLVLIETGWVTEGTLVVRNGPLGGAHHTQVVVSVRVVGTDEGSLREGGSLN